jgi:phosphonopyruvate decarboxylase
MIEPKEFVKTLIENNLGPIVEVPCSYFKSLLSYVIDTKQINVINPVNEAVAVGIATGKYLATKRIPIVMIQNSGLLNTLNALTSLNQVYCIPIFYIISWRGEKAINDAPEHSIVGANLEKILDNFNIPYKIMDENDFPSQVKKLTVIANRTKKPVALIIRENTFAFYKGTIKNNKYKISRFESISLIKQKFLNNALFISSTGYPSRDSFVTKNKSDFYLLGSMGHTFSIGLGIAENTNKKIVIFDGDGSSFMQLGGLASYNRLKHKNLLYVVLDNEVYESTGAQPSVSRNVDFKALSKAFNFKHFYSVEDKTQLEKAIAIIIKGKLTSVFLHIKISSQSTQLSPRISETPTQIKNIFLQKIARAR